MSVEVFYNFYKLFCLLASFNWKVDLLKSTYIPRERIYQGEKFTD